MELEERATINDRPSRWMAVVAATFCWIVGPVFVLGGLFMGCVMAYFNTTLGPIESSPDQDALNHIALTPGNIGYVGSSLLAGASYITAAIVWPRGPVKRAILWTTVAMALSVATTLLNPFIVSP